MSEPYDDPLGIQWINESLCPACGRESCEGHAETPGQPESPAHTPRWQQAVAVIDSPMPDPIIEGIAWSGSVSVVVGEPAAGKTFVALDLAAAVSAGIRWHGREVQQGSVIYVGYEGHVGLRLRALRDVAGHRLEHVYIIRATEPLSPVFDRDRYEIQSPGELALARDCKDIVAHVTAAGLPDVTLLIIDTVRASLSGSEDSSEGVSAYLRAVRRLMGHLPVAATLLAHHSGWQDGEARRKRERGSSAFRGNVDGTFYLEGGDYDRERGEARLTLSTLKVRDGETSPPLHLVRRRVELPGLADRWGQPVTSCVIERDRRTREDREAEAAAALEAETRAFDIRVLRGIVERPDLATSQDGIRALLGTRKTLVADSLARLVRHGWVLPGRRGQSYEASEGGHAALREAMP